MKVAIVFKNQHGRWEAVTGDKNKIRFVGPTFTGFKTRRELERTIEMVCPGEYTLAEAEF